MSNTTIRILTALVGAPVVLGLVYLGGWPFGLLVAALAVGAQAELYALARQGGLVPWRVAGLVLGALVALHPLLPAFLPAALAGAMLLVAALPFVRSERPLESLAVTLLGLAYPAAALAFLTDIRLGRGPLVGDTEAFGLTLGLFLMIWATDSLAYFSGRAFGRHPLAPKVSPKKTWEGAIGGALGSVLVAVGLKLTLLAALPWVHLLVLAVLCGVVSQLGDLAESRLKRSVGAKDSGSILPGHGGLLDRFDAMILAAPLAYLYLAWVGRLFH